MSHKENMGIAPSISANPFVKPEPQETTIQPMKASSSLNREAFESSPTKVKPEPRDGPSEHTPTASDFVAKAEEDVFTTAAAPPPPPPEVSLYNTYEAASDIPYTPEAAFNEGLGMVQTIRNYVKKLQLGSKLRQEVWMRELDSLQSQTSPKTLIAVCGATGAGKSSILNAILDDNVVPTSGMRACTAVVTEIAYHNKPTIDADVSFLSLAEWKEELSVLLTDLVDEEGNLKRSTDLKSDAGVAWQKVHAVYPSISQEVLVTMTPDQIIARDQTIAKILGATKNIVAKDSKTFAREIAKYIDSKDQSRGKKGKKDAKEKEKEKEKGKSLMDKVREAAGTSRKKDKKDEVDAPALWPLIRQVNVRCSSAALSTGAILVDLPGVADANAARNNIAKDYMKKCACIWILAPITRAVDDKTARDLLGDAFKVQLMNGNYDAHTITFIASKCDDISCSEVIRALRLDDDPELEEIEERIEQKNDETKELKRAKAEAEKVIKGIDAELKSVRPRLKEYQEHLEALKNGESFTPVLTGKAGEQKSKASSKKRRNSRGGKKGSPKKRRSVASDDEDDDMGSDEDEDDISDEESEANSDSDSDEDKDSDDEDKSDAGSNADDDAEEEEEVTEEILQAKIDESKAAIKSGRARLSEARQQKKDAADALGGVSKALGKIQREKNAFCSLKRSEFSRDVLKEDFRTGLKDLDDAAAEERDPTNFNPNVNIRDYEAIDLPVFTCSSRDYVRLKGQVKGDGEPSCFFDIKDTGIPDLQQWCHQLTLSSREKSARNFFTQLKAFATSVETYVQGIGDVTAIDRATLRDLWESTPQDNGHTHASPATDNSEDEDNWDVASDYDPFEAILGGQNGLYTIKKKAPKVDATGQLTGVTPLLAKDFSAVVDKSTEDLQALFRDGLEEKCRLGASNAAEAAVPTTDEFASSMHWGTYRATLRRHGAWRRDFNVELTAPFTRQIAASWSKVFETNLFAPFEASATAAVNKIIASVEASAAAGLKDRVRNQGELCLQEAKVALRNTIELVQQTMQNEQKEVSRCLAPHVQAQLVEGYDRAMEERGTGSVARQKTYFRGFISDIKNEVFDDGADVLMERLTGAAEAIGATLDDALAKLAQKVEVNLAVLWEGTRDDPKQLIARKQILEVSAKINGQINLWVQAEKAKRENDALASQYLADDHDVDMN